MSTESKMEDIGKVPVESNEIEEELDIPRPICILKATGDHTFELDIEALEKILLQDHIREKKVVVVSVAGAFRKGKSFLLDFFLRYLQRGGNEGWIGEKGEELTGFSWRGGAERETTGVMLWSEPFLTDLPSGEKVVVLLMDTQGAFDTSSTVKDCATVFAVSTMTSSVQVFNISSNLQEDHLQHLQLFTEYGRLAMEENDYKPFQRLEFLIRDWSYPYEYPYGDGQKLLDKRLSVGDDQHSELKEARKHISDCFENVGCFLMPHPGKVVATNPSFKGHLTDIDDEFQDYLLQLVPRLLAPANLVVKSINGMDVTCLSLVQYFRSYVKIFQGGQLPEPKSMLQATAEANNLAALATAKDQYQRDMEQVCGGDMPYLSPHELENKSDTFKFKAKTLFTATRKMGSDDYCKEYEKRLEEEIDELFENFVKLNDSKNVFNAVRTPAVFTVLIIVAYMLSGFFNLVGLTSIASIFNITMGLALLAIIVWSYVRFSGEIREIGVQLDNLAELIWDEIFLVVYEFVLQQGSQAIISRQVSKSKQS